MKYIFDYNDPDVIARQNKAPNVSCAIEGVFYDMRNLVHKNLEMADRIEELEAELSKKMDEDDYIAELEYKIEAAEEKLAKVKDALSAFKVFEDSAFRGVDPEKIKRSAYRGVKRKLLAALNMLEVE